MNALKEAIRRARPRTDVDAASPFGGLRRRHASTVDVVAQSVAAIAPAGVLLVHPSVIYAGSGSFAFVYVVIAVALVGALVGVVGVFSRRISSTGSLYTYVSRGLGPFVGTLAGAALVVGTLAMALSTLVRGSARIARVLSPSGTDVTAVAIVVTVVASILTAGAIARGLRISTRALLVVEVLAILVALGLSVYALTVSGWDLQLLVPDPSTFDPTAVAAAVTVAVIGFVGFESGAALGPETRRPFAAVPRGVLASVGAVAVVLLVGTAAQLSLVAADGQAPSLSSSTSAGWAVDLLVGVSFLACSLAMTNATTRLVFSLAREGLLPAALGRTSARGVPAIAGVTLTALLAASAVTIHLAGDRIVLWRFAGPAAAVGFFTAYALMCVAAVAFLARLRELTIRTVVLASAPAVALVALLLAYAGEQAAGDPSGLLVAVTVVIGVAGAGIVRLLRIPPDRRRTGMHDWAVASQTLQGAVGARRD